MNFNFYACILSSNGASLGFLWIVVGFLLCFALVHAVVLIKIGWKSLGEDERGDEEEKSPPEQKSESVDPVYYIVEKKRKRPRGKYSKPREFEFK